MATAVHLLDGVAALGASFVLKSIDYGDFRILRRFITWRRRVRHLFTSNADANGTFGTRKACICGKARRSPRIKLENHVTQSLSEGRPDANTCFTNIWEISAIGSRGKPDNRVHVFENVSQRFIDWYLGCNLVKEDDHKSATDQERIGRRGETPKISPVRSRSKMSEDSLQVRL